MLTRMSGVRLRALAMSMMATWDGIMAALSIDDGVMYIRSPALSDTLPPQAVVSPLSYRRAI